MLRVTQINASLLLALSTWSVTPAAQAEGPANPGLQLYSLRSQFKLRGVDWTLDQLHAQGITEVELIGSTYNIPVPEFLKKLSDRGIKAVSTHIPFDRLKNDLTNVIKDVKEFGVKYAGCAWIPHKESFDEAECRDAIAVFNNAGEALAKEGIQFFYHVHGYEFQPHGDGTLFDLFMKETHPKYVAMQLDVVWVVFPGQDPVKLIEKYSDRWKLIHLKDLKKEIKGDLTGHTDGNNNVILGQGQVNWPAVLAAAQKHGITEYLLEDESDKVLEQLPAHLAYLREIAK
jgi:sugar phosphate isomerase/epimerase